MKKSVVAAVLFAALPLSALATALADDHVLVHPGAQRNFSRTPLPYTAVDSRPRFKLTPMFWTRLGLLVFGTGPLLAIILAASLGLLSDPDPNPIGPGLLAFFTFWPAVILIVWGLIASLAIGARKRNPEITPPAR